jgi:thiazole synthase
MRYAVLAGYEARRGGRIPRRRLAQASSPEAGTIRFDHSD